MKELPGQRNDLELLFQCDDKPLEAVGREMSRADTHFAVLILIAGWKYGVGGNHGVLCIVGAHLYGSVFSLPVSKFGETLEGRTLIRSLGQIP